MSDEYYIKIHGNITEGTMTFLYKFFLPFDKQHKNRFKNLSQKLMNLAENII